MLAHHRLLDLVENFIAGNETPRAASGDDLERILKENNQYVFSLIYKFNKDVDPKKPYSERDDIIVISDEAHRTQAGRLPSNPARMFL